MISWSRMCYARRRMCVYVCITSPAKETKKDAAQLRGQRAVALLACHLLLLSSFLLKEQAINMNSISTLKRRVVTVCHTTSRHGKSRRLGETAQVCRLDFGFGFGFVFRR